MCGWAPGLGAAAGKPGSQATALAGSSRSFRSCQGGCFHAPQAAPACSTARCRSGRGDVPSRAQGEARAESKQSGGERGREGEKELESQTQSGSTNGISGCPASGDDKQAWSLFAWAGGRGKGQKVSKGATWMSSETAVVAAPFPRFFRTRP